MINNITLSNLQPHYNYKSTENKNVNFGNKISIPKTPKLEAIEKHEINFECFLRKLGDKINSLINSKRINALYEHVINTDEKSKEYMIQIFDYGKMLSGAKEIEINVENESLMNIAKSDESCIFIINHDDQKQDPKMLGFFNSLLAREYILNEKAETCPRPKVILNDDILSSLNPKSRAVLEKVGSVGVDARLFSPNLIANGRTLVPLIKDFINNKSHIFIFPEGRMCAFNTLGLEYRFQTGVADIIGQIAKRKKQVKVIPLGFAYKGKVGSIHVGEPVYFKKDNSRMLVTKGNIDSQFASEKYTNFFKTNSEADDFKTITSDGKPVESEDIPDYVAGILCENLKICKEEAKKAISKSSPKENIPVYNVDL